MSDQKDFLDSASGESFEPMKFNKVDDAIGGVVMSDPRPIERPSLRDGTPEKQLPINLETANGPRTLWVRQGFMAGAIAEAVRAVGESEIRKGGKLAVVFVEERDTGKVNPAKIYKAKYEAPPKEAEPPTASIEDIFSA